MHPLNTVKGAITTGVVLAIVISIWLTAWADMGISFHWGRLDRWAHIVAGVTWIGLLYYFNVVQTPGLAAAAADSGGPGGAGISKYIAPRALLWFRWSAVATWVTGAIYLLGGFGNASAIDCGPGIAHQFHPVLAHAHVHGRSIAWFAVLSSRRESRDRMPRSRDQEPQANTATLHRQMFDRLAVRGSTIRT